MKLISDPTRRFDQRPLYELDEIEAKCDTAIRAFFKLCSLEPEIPLSTSSLSKLLEYHTDRCDFGRDLSEFGEDVEGLTQFALGQLPSVYISSRLREPRFENRRRMTMAHELGHVLFHNFLFQKDASLSLFSGMNDSVPTNCKRSTISRGGDWMEWQASFAGGALLMPASALSAVLERSSYKSTIPISTEDPNAREFAGLMAIEFKVSIEAAWIRLLQRGCLSPKHSQKFEF